MRRRWMFVLPVLALAACGSISTPSPAASPSPAQSASPSATASPPASASPPATGTPSAATTPSAPGQPLQPGMSGPAVAQLQQRLAALKYYPGPVDGQFGIDTLEAVWAFEEVQGLPAQDTVTLAMQRALADPRPPAVLVPGGGSLRIEINLADEVLVLYRDNQVSLISHVSTGGGYYFCSPGGGCGYAVTPTGNFSTTAYMPGWVTVPLGEMYNPVFFIDTAYAIHGDTDVPLEPVSHGCVRIPMDVAEFFYSMVPTPGTPVYIR
jgi:peptidoglycan hydrolase-like protein with peptidoglycan-binding domain